MVTVVVLSSSIPAIGKSSATNQMDWNGCCFTGNSNPCAGLTKQPLLQKLPEYSLLSIHSLPLKFMKSRNKEVMHKIAACLVVSNRHQLTHFQRVVQSANGH
jgi:hypothetical protein